MAASGQGNLMTLMVQPPGGGPELLDHMLPAVMVEGGTEGPEDAMRMRRAEAPKAASQKKHLGRHHRLWE